jgi:hypothetical protein
MARSTSPGREVFQCIEPFVVFHDGVPDLYNQDRMVLSGDPILRSHPSHFVPAADRVEAMTAAPGERRQVAIPDPEDKEPEDG